MAKLTYTEYFDDKVTAVAAALAAKAGGGTAVVTGPVTRIRRPKAGGGLEYVPPDHTGRYVLLVSEAETIIV